MLSRRRPQKHKPLKLNDVATGSGNAMHHQWLWEVTGPGRYQLVLTWEGRGTLTRTLVVP